MKITNRHFVWELTRVSGRGEGGGSRDEIENSAMSSVTRRRRALAWQVRYICEEKNIIRDAVLVVDMRDEAKRLLCQALPVATISTSNGRWCG